MAANPLPTSWPASAAGWIIGSQFTIRFLAITHPFVIRAAIAHALRTGPETFRHIDVAPLTRVRLSGAGGRWTLAALVPLKDERSTIEIAQRESRAPTGEMLPVGQSTSPKIELATTCTKAVKSGFTSL